MEAEQNDAMFQQFKEKTKFDPKKFLKNRAQEKRMEFNKRKLKILDQQSEEYINKMPKARPVGNFFP